MQNKIAVIFHSGYGHTARQAQAVAEGAGPGAFLVEIDQVGEISVESYKKIEEADAIIMGTPTYMGGPSWQFKKFADSTSREWIEQRWRDKVFGGFTNSASMNGDKQITLNYLFAFAMQHAGIWVGLGLLPSNSKSAVREDVNFLGAFSGAMMQTPSDASVEEVCEADIHTARIYGRRINDIVTKFKAHW